MSFVPLEGTELADFLEQSRSGFVESMVAAGADRADVESRAAAVNATVLRDGRLNPDHHVGRILAGSDVVGHLWISRDDADAWYVWDVAVDEAHRGLGYGRAAMGLTSDMARADGAAVIGLSVEASNDVARRLYRSMGYTETGPQEGPLVRMHLEL